ncbi:MAG: hypothetical protein HY343_09510 [Lentisphaerae bacterium]|nr:hypothetical protein [Lentisphaerota bacterium]
MISETTEEFRKQMRGLPEAVRALARQTYRRWQANPRHPSLQFKRIHLREPIYSVRIGIHWRAVCVLEHGTAIWFWIGSHAAYDALIKKMRRR